MSPCPAREGTGVLAIRLGHDDNGPLFDQLRVTGNAPIQSGSTLSLPALHSFFCNPPDRSMCCEWTGC